MALIKCPQCGKQVSDKATQCPNCGGDVKAEPIGKITFEWKGKWMAVDTMVYLSLNGVSVGGSKSYSFKNGFNVTTPIFAEESQIRINAGVLIDDTFSCHFEKGKNYICKLSNNRFMGGFTYQISEEGGKIVFKKGYSMGRKILCVLGAFVIIFSIIHLCGQCVEGDSDRKTLSDKQANLEISEQEVQFQEESKPTELEVGKTYTFTIKDMGFTSFYFDGRSNPEVNDFLDKLTDVNLTITFKFFKDGTSKFDILQSVKSDAWENDVEFPERYRPRNFTATQAGHYSSYDLKIHPYSLYDERFEAIALKVPHYTDGKTPMVYYEDAELKTPIESYERLTVGDNFCLIDASHNTEDFYIDKDFNVYFNQTDLLQHKNCIGKLKTL